MNILYKIWILLFISDQYRLCNSLDDIDLYASSIPFCRQGHSQTVIKSYDDNDINSIINEKVYIFGGKGVNYQRLNSNYLEDLWELSIDQSVRTTIMDNKLIRKTSDKKYDFNWLQVKVLSYHSNWPTRRSNFASTVIPFTINSTYSLSSSAGTSRIHSDLLLIYGGENDITFTKCDSNDINMNQNIDSSQDADIPHETKLDKKQLLKDLWILNIADTSKPWTNMIRDNSQSCDTSIISRHNLIKPTNKQLSLTNNNKNSNKHTMKRSGLQVNNHKSSVYEISSIDPGPRKGSILTVLPISNSILLFGGYGYLSKYPQNNDGNTTTSSPYTTNVNSNSNNNNSSYNNNIELGHNHDSSDRKCLSDLFQLDIATATNASNATGKNYDHQEGYWKRLADFNAPCLYGPAGVGVLDPFDSQEKLFLFGGRYISSNSVTTTTTKNHSSYSAQSNKSHSFLRDHNIMNTMNSNVKDLLFLSHSSEYTFSSSIWLYTLLSDTWHEIKRPSSNSNNWPPGRIYHSISYVHERNSVFISGGVLENTNEYSYQDDDLLTNKEDDITRRRKSRKGNNNKYTHHLDVWSFNLLTRSWKCHDNGVHTSSEEAISNKDQEEQGQDDHNSNTNKQQQEEVDIETLYPDMRSYSSLSILHLNTKKVNDDISNMIPHLHLMTFGGKWISDVDDNINEKVEADVHHHRLSLYQDHLLSSFTSYIWYIWNKSFMNNSHLLRPTTRSLITVISETPSLVTLPEMNDIWLYKLAADTDSTSSSSSPSIDEPTGEDDTRSNGAVSINDNKPDEEYWIFLSVGGCHAFDDGHMREPLDVVAMVALITIAASILFGLCFYKTLRPIITHFDSRYRGYSNLSDYSDTASLVVNETVTTNKFINTATLADANITNIQNKLKNKSYDSGSGYHSISSSIES